jgi:hypothetical protein
MSLSRKNSLKREINFVLRSTARFILPFARFFQPGRKVMNFKKKNHAICAGRAP